MKILKILSEIKTAIIENKLPVDSKARDKALTVIRVLSKDYVETVQKEYNSLVKTLDKLENQQRESLVPIKTKREELDKQQKEVESSIAEVSKDVKSKTRHKESREKELVNLRLELEGLAGEVTGVKISFN